MDTDAARVNMLKQQLRTCSVLDDDLLTLLHKTPRENFVSSKYRRVAFADLEVPIGHDQTMMFPSVEARMLAALAIQPSDKILEIGTGSGYVTALLAQMGQHVYTVELFKDLQEIAEKRITELAVNNVTYQVGNGAEGWEKQQPYDVICITGSMPKLPLQFKHQLKVGGRLFVILGTAPAMEAILIARNSDN